MQEYKQKLEFCQKKKQKLQLAIDVLEHEQRNFEKCIKTLERIQDTTGRGMEAEQNQRENKTKIETMIEENGRKKERQIKSKKRVKDNRYKNGILSSQVRTIPYFFPSSFYERETGFLLLLMLQGCFYHS